MNLFVIGLAGLEPTTSCAQSMPATNCRTDRYFAEAEGFEPPNLTTGCFQGNSTTIVGRFQTVETRITDSDRKPHHIK